MAGPGGAAAVIGNQPIAYGVPGPDSESSVVLDMALSVVAGSKIIQAGLRGDEIPEGWRVGRDGKWVTDPAIPGALAPGGGHKGYGLAVLIEIMSSVLTGGAVLGEIGFHRDTPDQPTRTGHWITAVAVESFMQLDDFRRRMASLRDEIHATPTAQGIEHVMLPGEPDRRFEVEAERFGIPLEAVVWDPVHELAVELGHADELDAARL